VTEAGGVLVVGSLNRDYVISVDRLPAPGETRLGDSLAVGCGGKGANQAVAAALLGAVRGIDVAMVGAVGDDDDGRALRAALLEAGVDVDDVLVRDSGATGAALITVAADGENTIVVAAGTNASVSAEEVREALRRRAPAVVVTQGELPADAVTATVLEAAACGARPVVNLAPVLALEPGVLALCDPLVVNESEAAELLGSTLVEGPAAAAEALAGTARSVVVTAGGAGAYVAVGERVHHVPGRRVEVVDTTGAGDAFTGALAVALAAGADLRAAVVAGCVAGGYATTRPGAQLTGPVPSDFDLDLGDLAEPS
jgi:ribokinase